MSSADKTKLDNAAILSETGAQVFSGPITAGTAGGNPSAFNCNLDINNTYPTIALRDTNNNSDFWMRNGDGNFQIYDEQNDVNRYQIATSGQHTINGNADFGNGIDVTGDITVTGTVDGVDIAALDTAAVKNSDLDGKGEILIGDGSGDPTALAVGTNDYVLTADSSEATGVKWAAASGGGGGGGALEFVSKTTTSSAAAHFDLTGRSDDSMYLLIGKIVKTTETGYLQIRIFDGSNNITSGDIDWYRTGSSGASVSDSDQIAPYYPYSTKHGFKMDISTIASGGYVQGTFGPCNDNRGIAVAHGSLNTTDRIGGIRVQNSSGNINTGSQFLLYKYKES